MDHGDHTVVCVLILLISIGTKIINAFLFFPFSAASSFVVFSLKYYMLTDGSFY